MPKILLFGAGSLGIPYAWVLSNAIGQDNVTAVCRSNYAEASRNGFTVHSKLWGENLHFKPRVANSVTEAVEQLAGDSDNESGGEKPVFDYVVIAAKAIPTTPSTAQLIAPAVTERITAIVLIQNGIAIEEEYATLYPNNPILSTVAYFPATQVSPGVIQHREIETLNVGTYPADAEAAHKRAAELFVDLLTKGGATGKLHDDVQRERWGKLLVNAVWNPTCALTRLRDRQFIEANRSLDLGLDSVGGGMGDGLGFIKEVMLEIAAVAQACGYADVNEELVDFQIHRAAVRDLPGVQPSMLADVNEAKSMEVDAIVGNAVRLARRKGVNVPMLKTIYLLANGLSEGFKGK
ncbi:6-phosphogluconate dehydrogenase C-terminal domain-like protein [Annulohypoxylon maeteangense]|uniref:6-phosphogluconate dehydrogenase C-terminal domain-like protein n=1 Tax=Annulohypoxylon maeteangense TaxID=1927788 RepID=UPI00200859CD|nr:6-phosphogluconate dehydrogenase C-terminal domain-like protein [Annulohypoxylon maeteangense]KAI0883447.1 6-phosphogluconate dehydrogenase C-terminal domain-like protein [Annulohypoxylon maeteangense]